MIKSRIAPAVLQEVFASAKNAAAKGQAQWFTPLQWAKVLALPLPNYRPVIADLSCGNGSLLRGAEPRRGISKQSQLLGCDIQPVSDKFTTADVTKLYPLLRTVKWQCDLFVLNPPWDLHWYREWLKGLADSDCPAVCSAFDAHDGRTPRDTIDSTIATLLIALDRSPDCGEGLLIGNEATLQRLIFTKDAPHRALATHVWAHLIIKGNICQPGRKSKVESRSPCERPPRAQTFDSRPSTFDSFHTGVIYFARAPQPKCLELHCADLEAAKVVCEDLRKQRLLYRKGPVVTSYLQSKTGSDIIVEGWDAAAEEYSRTANHQKPKFNIWLGKDGTIETYLSLFDQYSGRVLQQDAAKLYALTGKRPLQLVVQRSQRQALIDAVSGTTWRVDPALSAAVESAITEYNAIRAPLYPLAKIQRLGYLDEQDEIVCAKNLGDNFKQGRSYALRSTTVAVKRHGTKMNLQGELDAVEWNGQELAFFIKDESGIERCFMEARLREEKIEVNLLDADGKPGDKCAIHFTLQELAGHFDIPEVPDVATVNPQGYQRNLQRLDDIVALCNNNGPCGTHFRLKKFQREDYARIALHDGAILGHDTGLGKTIAMFLWPLLKTGFRRWALSTGTEPSRGSTASRLVPLKPVLLVVPGDGHDQTDDESLKHFKTKAVRLDSQETFFKLSLPDSRTGKHILPPAYYLTSYTQLAGNGVVPFPRLNCAHPEQTMADLNLTESGVLDWFNRRAEIYRREYALLEVAPESSSKEIYSQWSSLRMATKPDSPARQLLDEAYHTLRHFVPQKVCRVHTFQSLSSEQQQFIRLEFTRAKYYEYSQFIGTNGGRPQGFKCVFSPSLADLCQDCFVAIVVDEGTKMKGEETEISLGVRQINAPHRLVMSATPIKNRFPDVFRLAHYVCGGHDEPTPRFPYGNDARDDFAEEFLVSEQTIKTDANGKKLRGYSKLTPQVCNIHRAWKLFAPIILRRRKEDCGEDIVPKLRHVVRVPMGLAQAAVYQFHLNASYRDKNNRKAVGAQLQALRIAAANPASELLVRPHRDMTDGSPRSQYSYIPKVATTLSLIQQVIEQGEQVVVFGAFNDSLDVIGARLREAGVRHLVLDGRISQRKRGQLARLFKFGPPRAVNEKLSHRQSDYPVMLAGVECMAELHSFHLCNNAILMAYSWAWDKFEQAINRIHRLNSPWPVNVWSVICEGSIDRRLEANIHEKGDAAGLVLDSRLPGESPHEVNLAELLHLAHEEFNQVKTMDLSRRSQAKADELVLQKDWPRLRAALGKAYLNWQAEVESSTPNFHLPTTNAFTELPLWRQCSLQT